MCTCVRGGGYIMCILTISQDFRLISRTEANIMKNKKRYIRAALMLIFAYLCK